MERECRMRRLDLREKEPWGISTLKKLGEEEKPAKNTKKEHRERKKLGSLALLSAQSL